LRAFSKYEKLLTVIDFDMRKNLSFNLSYYVWISKMITRGKTINLKQYDKQPILYMFIIDKIIDNYEHEVICKIGFSQNIIKRYRRLINEYKCNFYLIDCIKVDSIMIEHQIHNHLKTIYPQLSIDVTIMNIKRKEIYIISPNIHYELYKYTYNIPLYLSLYYN
jgi:hypothetical protein